MSIIAGGATSGYSPADYFTSSGVISGSGTINISGVSGSVRAFNFSGASPYTGNWTASSNSATVAAVSSGASSALGSGFFTLNANSSLGATVSNGLNTLSGVTLNSSSATLNAPIGWTNPIAALTVNSGTLNVGSNTSIGAISVGSLSQNGGTVNLYSTALNSDVINLTGGYNYSAGTIALQFSSPPTASSYTLVNYGGALSGTPNVTYSLAGVVVQLPGELWNREQQQHLASPSVCFEPIILGRGRPYKPQQLGYQH